MRTCMAATDALTPPAAPSSRRVSLIVAAALFMLLLDGAILNTSLPNMAASLGVTPLALTSAVTVYLLAAAALMPASGWIADRFGPRRVFLTAMAVFTLASMACGFASGLHELMATRFVQGLAAGVMAPVGRTLALRNARKAEVMGAMALIVWPSLLAPVIGPPLGGLITTYASWRWNFFINLPIGMLGVLAVLRWVPDMAVPRPGRLDLRGALLSGAALVLLLFGLERGAQAGPQIVHWAAPAMLVGAGIGSGLFALRHLRRAAHPVVSLAPFDVRTFRIATVSAGSFFVLCLQATPFLVPLMFQIAFGLNAVQAGLFTLAYFLGNLSMKTLTTPLLRRFGFRRVMVVNGTLAATAILACALLRADTPVVVTVALLVMAGATRSMQMTALNTLAFADIDPALRAPASTLSSMCTQVSSALGAAVGALLLALSQIAHGRSALAGPDFKVAFVCIGLIALASVAGFARLRPADGAEVSGHRAARRAA